MSLADKLNTLIIGLDEIVDELNNKESEDYLRGLREGVKLGKTEMRTLAATAAERLYGHKEARQAIMRLNVE